MDEVASEVTESPQAVTEETALFRRWEDLRISALEFQENLRNSSWERIIFCKKKNSKARYSTEKRSSREVPPEACSWSRPLSRSLCFHPQQAVCLPFRATVPSNKLTPLPGHHSHFHLLLHEKVVHKPVQICGRGFSAQALPECAQLLTPNSCILLPESFPQTRLASAQARQACGAWALRPSPGAAFSQGQTGVGGK